MGAQGGGLLGQKGCEHDACSLALSYHGNTKRKAVGWEWCVRNNFRVCFLLIWVCIVLRFSWRSRSFSIVPLTDVGMKRKHITKRRYEEEGDGVFCIVHGISQKITLWKCLNLIVNFMLIFKQESAVVENWALSQFWVTPHKCPNKDTMHSVDDHYESWPNNIHPAKHWQDDNTKHSSKQLTLWCNCRHLNICHIYEVSSQKNPKKIWHVTLVTSFD